MVVSAGPNTGESLESVRRPKSVSTSGSHSRSAADSRAARPARPPTAASRAASPRRDDRPVGLDRHRLGPSAPSRSRSSAASRSQRSSPDSRASARSAACAAAWLSTSASGEPGAVPSGRRMPPWSSAGDRVDRVAPALLGERAPGAAAQRTKPPPRSSAPSSHAPAARHAPQLVRERAIAGRGEQHEEPRGRVRGAVVGERALGRPARLHEPLGRPSRNSWPILPGSSSVPGCSSRPCQARERAQRRARHVGALREHLQRADQRVTPEQRVEAAWVARLDRRRRGVRPALLREQLVEPGRSRAARRRRPRPARAQRAINGLAVARAVRADEHAAREPTDLDRASPQVHGDRGPGAAPPRPRAGRRRQRLVAPAAQVLALAPQRDQVAHEVQDRARVLALGRDVVAARSPNGSHGAAPFG